MIHTESLADNLLKITVEGALQPDDLPEVAQAVDKLLKKSNQVSLVVDVRKFSGWKSIKALEQHVGLVKARHTQVNRIAFITSHLWQRLIINTAKRFLHPTVKIYTGQEMDEAISWIKSPKS